MPIYCFLRGIWRSLTTLAPWDGHTFQDEEEHKNVTVTLGHCEDCGKFDISWRK